METRRKKLIEIALPLEPINAESAREKSIRHGHPSTLHLWWARRPLATCRAVWWASLVDDPSSWPEKFPTENEQKKEHLRLFDLLARFETQTDKKGNTKQTVQGLVSWDEINKPNSPVLEEAQREIARSLAWNRNEEPPTKPQEIREYIAKYAPPAYDPFCGGGSIPLEAQRLGLEAHGSDLNPVAVLITKALIEIPPKFKDKPPVSNSNTLRTQWHGAQGLAEDVRYYGEWMRDEAFKRIGHLYPKVKLPTPSNPPERGTIQHGGGEATVIAWLWARTVKCPNPACGCLMPLIRSFEVSTKKGKEAWVEPIVEKPNTSDCHPERSEGSQQPETFSSEGSHKPNTSTYTIKFEVKTGKGKALPGTVNRKGATCIACNTPVNFEYIRSEASAGRMGSQLMAIVAEGKGGRVYLSPDNAHEKLTKEIQPEWKPSEELQGKCKVNVPLYGMHTFADLFTPRQLVALTTFSDLVTEAREKIIAQALSVGMSDDGVSLSDGGSGAVAYGDAVATYLAFGVDRLSDRNSTICSWDISRDSTRNTFARQAIPMTWDYAEANPLSDSTGNFCGAIDWIVEVINNSPCNNKGKVVQIDATATQENRLNKQIISSDPPYYDNIGYADLADFFYVWLRKSLRFIYPDIFSTLLVPKATELVATPYRFEGDKEKAKTFFESGLGKAFSRMWDLANPDYPLTVYYAFKQSETEEDDKNKNQSVIPLSGGKGVASTGWETMLEGLIKADFTINGTWPMRTELSNRSVGQGTNALASSIVLVCRPRPVDAPKTTKRAFTLELKRELPKALRLLQQGNIAPVDLAQASIGPGMEIFSKYAAVLETDGTHMKVRHALELINQTLDEFLNEQEGEFDNDTRWALTWFEQHQFNEGLYGDAETLSKAKNTSVKGLEASGILSAKAGKVSLIKREELSTDWKPEKDTRIPVWEITQHLIYTLDKKGEAASAELLAKIPNIGDLPKDLAYRLYDLCERKGWTSEAIAYNSLVISWPEIARLASYSRASDTSPVQTSLF